MKKLLLTMIVSFALCGTMFAQTHSTHWPNFDYHQYSDNKGLVAYVRVDGQVVDQNNYERYEVAAFVGDDCRGVSFLKDEMSLGDAHPAFQMQVYYDAQEGQEEQLSFKLYDHVDSVEYSSWTPKYITGEPTTLYTDNWYLGVWGEPNSDEAIVLDFASAETQTIALSGTSVNYCSFYVDITLADLQTALTDVLGTGSGVSITIKSQTQNCKLTRGRWTGQLSSLDLGKMYLITVNSDCEITLEGMPVDPAAHVVTIVGNGNPTWIAYPFNTEMTVTDAFAGFATNGDVVKSKTQNSSYTRGRWNGQLQTLEPGQGYIYKSATNAADRDFVYPINNK